MKNKLMVAMILATAAIAGNASGVVSVSATSVTNKTNADIWINFAFTSMKGIRKADYTRVTPGKSYTTASSVVGGTLSAVAYACKDGKPESIKERVSVKAGVNNINIHLSTKKKRSWKIRNGD